MAEKTDATVNAPGLRALLGLNDGEHNLFVSPVSLGCALCMAAQGAKEETVREILAALGLSDAADMAGLSETLAQSGLRSANAAFVREGLAVKRDYVDALSKRFSAELFPLDDVDRVNRWVDQKTDHLIPRLVDEISSDTRLMLINAAALDAKWAMPFNPAATGEDVFYSPAGEVSTQFMRAIFKIQYGESALGQFVRLNYRDSSLYMLVVLPKAGLLEQSLNALAEDMDGAIPEMSEQKVRLCLPKLDSNTSSELIPTLRAQGIETVFSDAADLSGISDEALSVSEVLQKVHVRIDEQGTRAAAATDVAATNKARALAETPPVEMNVNRPYILFIADETTGAVCFAGTVYDPTQA